MHLVCAYNDLFFTFTGDTPRRNPAHAHCGPVTPIVCHGSTTASKFTSDMPAPRTLYIRLRCHSTRTPGCEDFYYTKVN